MLKTDNGLQTTASFRNEAFVDFATEQNRSAMRAAIDGVKAQLGQEYPLVVGGKRISASSKFTSTNPANPSEVIGIHSGADPAMIDRAIEAALKSFASWRKVSVEERADLLFRTARSIRERKFELSAWLVYEVGKNWAEADADTAEAIDFLEFYGREALRLAQPPDLLQLPGERDQLKYLPLGVGAVIPPWNFPLAITAGMTAAAIVTGNTVVLKPSPFAPTIAAKFLGILEECGMPPGVVNLCQGGAEAGEAIVDDPRIRFIAFTGSKKVGLDIHSRAARVRAGQMWIKRTVLEMGGKDCIIVERDADIESAVKGVVASAFGFSGQKCSACSRLVIDEQIHDEFVDRLVESAGKLAWGDPVENKPVGPVVSHSSYDKILSYLKIAKQEGKVAAGGDALTPPQQGYFIAPTIVTGVAPGARISREEIFGPVLAVMRSKDFENALAIANNTEYGLTGAVYTSDPRKIDRASEEFYVGNLYFNRKCTGAMVGVHPFGGFNMSGTDSKAGGPDYLALFMQAKSVAYKL